MSILASTDLWANLNFIKDNTLFLQTTPLTVKAIEENPEFNLIMGKHQSWGQQIDYDSAQYNVEYTFNTELETFIKKQLSLYRPDYTSVVVVDNETGNVIAAVDYSRAQNVFGRDLAFSTTHPAASIFKIITASDLLENTHIKTDTEFHFTGRSTTLYRHQLKEPATRRWIRSLDLERAFATSNNVIFGRTAIENLTPAGLKKMAEKFGFNKRLVEGVNLAPSVFTMAQDQYNLAELSSGLNTQTMMSPVHGAVIGSVVANGGVLRYPVVIKSLAGVSDKKVMFPPIKKDEQVLTPQSAEDLRTLFMATVASGTARSSFRRSLYLLNKLEIGGKTGSITGGEPKGKRDWFVSYAKSLEDKSDKGISICVMIVNQKRWYIKSPLLAKNIYEYYYSHLHSVKNKKVEDMQEDSAQPEQVQVPEVASVGLTKKQKFIKEVKSFTFIILSVLIFRSVLFEPFKIPSGSMIPTLLIGDFILVNKFSYGFKVPFSDWFTEPVYMTGPKQPERGDVIVFKYPKDPNLNYIKRVVGLPGDTIEVIDKVVYVNNKPIETKEIDGKAIMEDMDDRYKSYQFKFLETKTGDATHISQVDVGNSYFANYYKFTVPKDNFFVMGDNRDFSADSRRWGTVPFGNIKGKAIAVWFSLSVPWPWSEDEQESWKFRPWRIGKLID